MSAGEINDLFSLPDEYKDLTLEQLEELARTDPEAAERATKALLDFQTNLRSSIESKSSGDDAGQFIISVFDYLRQDTERRLSPDEAAQRYEYLIENLRQALLEHSTTAEAAARFTKELPRLKSKVLKKHTSPIHKLANELPKGLINDGEIELMVIDANKKRNLPAVYTKTLATYDPGASVEIEGTYSFFDREVGDAILSIYLHGDPSHCFTPDMVYRAMTSNQTVNPSPQQVGAVTRSIERQRRIHVKIDASEEMKARGIVDENGEPISFRVGDFLLVLKDLEIKAGGKVIKGYQISSEPLLYSYAKLTGQIISVDANLLDVREVDNRGLIGASIANSEGRISIKGYLLRRVQIMKKDQQNAADSYRNYEYRRRKTPTLPEKPISSFFKQSRRILFETVFKESGEESENRVTQRRNREYVFSVLDYWTAIKHISGYEIVKEGKKITGIDIKL